MVSQPRDIVGEYKYGFRDPENYVFKSDKGLTREIVESISSFKKEPDWMREIRLKALDVFLAKPMPTWGTDLSEIDFNNIHYFVRATDRQGRSWDEVPEDIKRTFDRLGIPEAERKYLAGVSAQYESEVVYHNIRKDLEAQGVLFCDMDTAVREYPDIVREYFGTIVPMTDNKFAALNTAVWSGGSFIYVPPGVTVEIPLQAYFRINTENMGQFERTLIIVDEGANVHYVEGCTAPTYSSDSLHAAVVEIIVKKGARCRYSTIQNWSTNVYNLVTKRAVAYEDAVMEWVDGNIGSKVTMKYPAIYLMGPRARGEVISIAVASKGMIQDAGAKIYHFAPDTSSRITSKSISRDGGNTTYRGHILVEPQAERAKVKVECDALIFDDGSESHTIPYMDIKNQNVTIEHEATVSRVSEEQLFYLMSRGLSEEQALAMVVMGFIEPFARELPMEYAVELNRLIEMEMEGSVG
ncbi:Fe-S cluster assembly protein SufB [Symbiobacterium terraclitae]|uniref:Fe-S cluster assembly protein SufB n=1 Tax=Symbiobacterium terraclitae TaxID=557451 RepID=A0ABS4JTX7_9FIRM|nr:Fe-S cluster assembly protein SufB [Symbiobacterium terraclitae]MBP2018983.1 Fe-S cluster assembly protein SufB [Symbiobacterium terraclitae]